MQDIIPLRNSNNFGYWNPFAFARRLTSWPPSLAEPTATPWSAFLPRLEVSETDEGYLVLADVPGVREDDLDVTVLGNQLTITGERRLGHPEGNDTRHVRERTYGRFVRTVALPSDADANDVSADLDDGVLRLTIGKREDSKPRKISLAQRLENKRGS